MQAGNSLSYFKTHSLVSKETWTSANSWSLYKKQIIMD